MMVEVLSRASLNATRVKRVGLNGGLEFGTLVVSRHFNNLPYRLAFATNGMQALKEGENINCL